MMNITPRLIMNPLAFAQLGAGIIKSGIGLLQRHEGKKLMKGLQYPTEALPTEVIENQNAARQQAATGLPSEQYANAMKNIQRQQLMALRGAHDRRGGLGILPGIQQVTNDATLNLDAQDAQLKLANQRQLMNVNNQAANWKSQLFDRNVRDKYNRDYDYAMSLIGSGNQNFASGLDSAASGGLGFIGGGGGIGRSRTRTQPFTMTEADFQRD